MTYLLQSLSMKRLRQSALFHIRRLLWLIRLSVLALGCLSGCPARLELPDAAVIISICVADLCLQPNPYRAARMASSCRYVSETTLHGVAWR